MEVAILVVAAATFTVTGLLAWLAKGDAKTQRAIRASADATRLAAVSSKRTAEESHDISKRAYRRTCLHGLETCLIELKAIVDQFDRHADVEGVHSVQAQMTSYLFDIPDGLSECRRITVLEMPWSDVEIFRWMLKARYEIHTALTRSSPALAADALDQSAVPVDPPQ
jgi:hypothetical protein